MTKISYSGYRFPPEIIQQAIWLYVRFTLSFRDVEDLLAERGILVFLGDGAPLGEPFWTQDRCRSSQTPAEASHHMLGWTAPTASMCQNEVVAERSPGRIGGRF